MADVSPIFVIYLIFLKAFFLVTLMISMYVTFVTVRFHFGAAESGGVEGTSADAK
jgi:hypothetical protein